MEAASKHNTEYTLLVVEDESGLRRSISDYFSDSGFRVEEADSGRTGLAVFRTSQPDIVFTDLCMPDGNGLELIAAIHAESPLTPIVVISGAGMVADAVESMKLGACDYLCKPIRDMATLENLACQAIERSRQQQRSKATGADHLTGLPNRSQMENLFREMGARGTGVTLVLVDLDSFKGIKDAFGHAVADRLLMEVGERLSLQVNQREAIIHLGEDEFAMLLATSDNASVDVRVAMAQEVVVEPFRVGQDELTVTASVGIAVFPHDGSTSDELLKNASTALYEAKKVGKNSVKRYSNDILTNSERFSLQAKLHRALERREFELVYQPQYDLDSGALHGFEALLRWHPLLGHTVAPTLIIPSLEESGLIVQVGEWILREACTHYLEWRSLGVLPCKLSVNVSAVQFHSSGFVNMVRRVLHETGMSPDRLCLELTESVVMRDGEEAIATMSALKGMGIALSLDDFGTGYSSLSYLSRMPLDELKIDRSFVSSLSYSTSQASIVDTIIAMATTMNLRVVAEGIEQAEQAAFLLERKCHIAQGYYFSRPLSSLGVIKTFAREQVPTQAPCLRLSENRDIVQDSVNQDCP